MTTTKLVVVEGDGVRTVAERDGDTLRVVDLADAGVRVRLLRREAGRWVVAQDAWLEATCCEAVDVVSDEWLADGEAA